MRLGTGGGEVAQSTEKDSIIFKEKNKTPDCSYFLTLLFLLERCGGGGYVFVFVSEVALCTTF